MSTSQQGPGAQLVGALITGGIMYWFFTSYSGIWAGDGTNKSVLKQIETPAVTMAQFKALKTGMTYDQVKKVMGSPGEETSNSSVAGVTMQMYSWGNLNGSNMILTFTNGKLDSKTQIGLK